MVERGVPRLRSSGQDIVSAPLTSRERNRAKPSKESCGEDEQQASDTRSQSSKKPESTRGQREPQTARGLLEVNKQLVEKKKEEHAMARKKSREFIDEMLQGDQKIIESDKAKDVSRRMAQKELARYYKGKIVEKEQDKANSYKSKLDAGAGEDYFPYTEGEHINKTRQAQHALMREEMRGFLKEQRDTKPGRAGKQLEKLAGESTFTGLYEGLTFGELEPEPVRSGSSMSNAKQPRFLTRPTAHMSRRIQDDHVRKALEEQVQRTKEDLEKLQASRVQEAQAWEEGMTVNDALRYDAAESKSSERKKNASYLRAQIEERERKDAREKEERRQTKAGYWGPEEKRCLSGSSFLNHNSDLIAQMEVNQHRRLDSRNRRLIQERRLVDNSLAEISQDRDVERQKLALHKEVLVTTWDSQRKIREVMNRIEAQS